jgi:hypothetical protein
VGQNRELSRFPNAITVLDNGNVAIAAVTTFGASNTSRIEAASNIISGFYGSETNARVSIGRDVFGNGRAGISLGSEQNAAAAWAGIGVNDSANGNGNALYFSLSSNTSTGNFSSSIYCSMTSGGLSYTTPSSTSNILNITTNASWTSGYLDHTAFMAPNITGGALSLGFGKSNASYNLGKIVFNYAGNQSSSNSIGIGFYNYDNKLVIVGDGTVRPGASGTQNLGTASYRWGTVYTSDLSLSNGIGDYTIVEGENDLFLYNNKQGKVYKFSLIEVDPATATPKKS